MTLILGTCELPLLNSRETGMTYRQTTIEILPEDTLLEIFDFYRLDAIPRSSGRPWKWHRLAHVCQKWRRVMSLSPRRLGLRILCKSKTPIEHIMDFWPTLPLVVRYKNPKPSSLNKNIVAALRRPDRVCEIDLNVTIVTTGPIVELIQEPFLLLERVKMKITHNGATTPPVFTTFLGGSAPRLEEIELDGVTIPFPALRRLLLSTNNLVRLTLWNIPNTCYFPPDALVPCLSALVHLKSLWVGFGFPVSFPSSSRAHLPLERATLPSLTFLNFRGASEYLEGVVARTNFPSLTGLWIRFSNQLVFEVSQLYQFMSRVHGLKSFSEVIVIPSVDHVTITLTQRGERRRNVGQCSLEIKCSQLNLQLSSMTQIFSQLSPLLSNVKTLAIRKSSFPPTGQEDVALTQWLELFQLFPRVWEVRVIEELVPGVVHALATEDMATGMLPRLIFLHLEKFRQSPSMVEAVEQFVAVRGHRIRVYDYA